MTDSVRSSRTRRDASAVRVHRGDAMRLLPRLPGEIADLVLTDPPYGIAYQPWKGDRIANDDAPFVWWLREAWRITRPGGSLLCFCRWDVQEAWRWAATLAGWRVRSQVIWQKAHSGMGDCAQQFIPSHEVIWFAVKSRAFRFPGRRPASVITVNAPPARQRTHPTEKPVALLRQLIAATTRPGDLVLDPFSGTGSTPVSCAAEGRRCIAMELEAKYVAIARRRVRVALREQGR